MEPLCTCGHTRLDHIGGRWHCAPLPPGNPECADGCLAYDPAPVLRIVPEPVRTADLSDDKDEKND